MKATALDPDTLTPGARRVLDSASELFYERGITAVGVDLIAQHSGVTKRTLYNRFGSKEALVATYLLARDRRWRAHVAGALATSGLTPQERATAPFRALRTWMLDNRRGCAFINALAELPDPEHPGHRVAADQQQWLLELFTSLATEADLRDPGDLAHQLLCLYEGALAVQTPATTRSSAETVADAASVLVRAAAPSAP
ncbi:TetR/AcrR family transcriptional regulator [Nocardiopsis salina]|uniref:TetR/AcrR family transcriptional regulator n=1 Tax=Nocardiopsis salina TaxID=245836 RepID=UPI00034BE47B|nr:TetR family transcriptional regulator [Nocardiopsis salina]